MSLPRHLSALTALATPLAVAAGLLTTTGATAAPAPTSAPTTARSQAWPGHPDRAIVVHRVARGETATGLAVRYHAWTRELLALNHLHAGSPVYVGQRLRIPVVLSAVRKSQGAPKPSTPRPKASALHGPRWTHADLSRSQVRALVVRTARAHDVPPTLALAIAWQESGWQQRRLSSAGAVGVMQVLPSTGRWMRWYAGRPLRIRDAHDNVLTGVLTLRYLLRNTRLDDRAIAAYYQGLGAVRERGLFDDTKQYVRAVKAHQERIRRTGSPV